LLLVRCTILLIRAWLTVRHSGTSRGFRIYHTDPFAKIFSSDDGNVALIEMLFSTSLVALILSPRHLVIQNTKAGFLFSSQSFLLIVLPEVLNHLRTHVSFCSPCRTAQSQTACCSIGRGNLLVRHFQHDSTLHNRHIAES
jgi:hypothetical protein